MINSESGDSHEAFFKYNASETQKIKLSAVNLLTGVAYLTEKIRLYLWYVLTANHNMEPQLDCS